MTNYMVDKDVPLRDRVMFCASGVTIGAGCVAAFYAAAAGMEKVAVASAIVVGVTTIAQIGKFIYDAKKEAPRNY